MINNIDSLIKQEFERLGLNIVESEGLADLIITRVRRERMRRILGGFAVALLTAGAIAVGVAASSMLLHAGCNATMSDQVIPGCWSATLEMTSSHAAITKSVIESVGGAVARPRMRRQASGTRPCCGSVVGPNVRTDSS